MSQKINIKYPESVTGYYCHYDGQIQHQPIYIMLDDDGDLYIDYDGEIGEGMSSRVWHGVDRRYPVPYIPSLAGARRLLDRIAPLAQRVNDGRTVEHNGSNWVGRLTEGAIDAEHDIEGVLNSHIDDPDAMLHVMTLEQLNEYNVLHREGRVEIGNVTITADTTDEQIEQIAGSLLTEARNCREGNVYIEGDGESWLTDIRDELRAETADA